MSREVAHDRKDKKNEVVLTVITFEWHNETSCRRECVRTGLLQWQEELCVLPEITVVIRGLII
jgi:hypothetical protein